MTSLDAVDLTELTPVEEHAGLWFKREDKFAPLGYGGINGSKLRQLIWMTRRHVMDGIISAANPRSPQIIMGAVVAACMEIPFIQVLGTQSQARAEEFSNVAAAARLGTTFYYGVKPGYDRNLEIAAASLMEQTSNRLYWRIPHAIGPEDKQEREFHELGALQVQNLPAVTNLIIPHGSTNSAASILLGILKYKPPIKSVWMLGISPPSAQEYLYKRMQTLGVYDWDYDDKLPRVHFEQLHGMYPWAAYDYRQPAEWDDIDFHPTYEGKMMRWLTQEREDLLDDSCFWIVGSEPHYEVMAEQLKQYEGESQWLRI